MNFFQFLPYVLSIFFFYLLCLMVQMNEHFYFIIFCIPFSVLIYLFLWFKSETWIIFLFCFLNSILRQILVQLKRQLHIVRMLKLWYFYDDVRIRFIACRLKMCSIWIYAVERIMFSIMWIFLQLNLYVKNFYFLLFI